MVEGVSPAQRPAPSPPLPAHRAERMPVDWSETSSRSFLPATLNVANDLPVIRLENRAASRFDDHQLTLIKAIGAIEISKVACPPPFSMQPASIRLAVRDLLDHMFARE